MALVAFNGPPKSATADDEIDIKTNGRTYTLYWLMM